jgi:small-conductance mechanosensitive channel
MFNTIAKIVKWASMPALMLAAVFSGLAAGYEALAGLVICVAAVILVQRALWSREYYWAAGFAAACVMSSPLLLVVKVFLLMGLACTVVSMALLAAFRAQPVTAGTL